MSDEIRAGRDLAPSNMAPPYQVSRPTRSAIWPSVTWACESPEQADGILGGRIGGYAYQRDGSPNCDVLSEKCRLFHRARNAVVTSTGMSALALAMLACLKPGDHVLLSSRMYGKTMALFGGEGSRWGLEHTVVDVMNPEAVRRAMTGATRMLVCETISNPTLRVADLGCLANLAHEFNSLLLVDNTFASPVICRPLDFGADLVVESMTKIMNGHSDTVMGLLCGNLSDWKPVSGGLGCFGMNASPFSAWLCERGLMTLYIRVAAACDTAMKVAGWLQSRPEVRQVDYPGLAGHPDHALAVRQFQPDGESRFGFMVTFHLEGGGKAAAKFIENAGAIHYCTSLGEPATTLSHPASSSHRSWTIEQKTEAGFDDGTIRMSIGLETAEFVMESLDKALTRLD